MKKLFTLLLFVLAFVAGMQAQPKVYILGNAPFGGWNPSAGVEMASTDYDTFTYTVELETKVWFSFTTKLGSNSGDWSGISAYRIAAPSNNYDLDQHLGEEVVCGEMGKNVDNAFMVSAGKYDMKFVLSTRTLTVTKTGDGPQLEDTGKVYIVGEVNGNLWDSSYGEEMLSEDQNVYTLDVSCLGENAGFSYFSFTKKLSENVDEWGAIDPYRFGADADADFLVTEEMLGTELGLSQDGKSTAFKIAAGDYHFELNLTTRKLVITGTMTPPIESDDVFVMGEVDGNGWFPNKGVKMETEDNENYSIVITTTGANEGYSYFSFSKVLGDDPENWDAINAYRFGAMEPDTEITDELKGTEIDLSADGVLNAFKIGAGTYLLQLNKSTRKLVVTDTDPIPAEVYILGQVNGNDWAPNVGVQMDTEDHIAFTATIEIEGSVEGYNYFSFTKKLADGEDQSAWDSITGYRFGALIEEGDFEVTNELLGTEIQLGQDGQGAALKIAKGNYDLALDLNARTLVITRIGGVYADVNGDGTVNVTDVNLIVSAILNGEFIAGYDVNGDGGLNVTDINLCVSAILNQNH